MPNSGCKIGGEVSAVLRYTFASNPPALWLEMGHRDLSLLRPATSPPSHPARQQVLGSVRDNAIFSHIENAHPIDMVVKLAHTGNAPTTNTPFTINAL